VNHLEADHAAVRQSMLAPGEHEDLARRADVEQSTQHERHEEQEKDDTDPSSDPDGELRRVDPRFDRAS
jgi:hypothetical protein